MDYCSLSRQGTEYLAARSPAPASVDPLSIRYLCTGQCRSIHPFILLGSKQPAAETNPCEAIDAFYVWGDALISTSYLHLLAQRSKTIRPALLDAFIQCNRGGTLDCVGIVPRLREAAFTPVLKPSFPAVRLLTECICSCTIRYYYLVQGVCRLRIYTSEPG